MPLSFSHLAVLSVFTHSTGLVDRGLIYTALLLWWQQRSLRAVARHLVLRLARRSHSLTIFDTGLLIVVLVESVQLLI